VTAEAKGYVLPVPERAPSATAATTITLGVHRMRRSVLCQWTSTKDSFRVTFEHTQAESL
jgi:hypothetical protein